MTWSRGVALAAVGVWAFAGFLLAAWASAALALDGNALIGTSIGAALAVGTLVPLALGGFGVRSMRARGRQVGLGRVLAGAVFAWNAVLIAGIGFLHPSPWSSALGGASRWVGGPVVEAGPGIPPEAPPSGSVAGARAAAHAVLAGSDARAVAEGLTDESAGAIAAVWMRFLVDTWGDELRQKAGEEAWSELHRGLPAGDHPWEDPAALEAVLARDGRAALGRVGRLADALAHGDAPVRLADPFLPESVLRRRVPAGASLAEGAQAREVALNRVEIDLPGVTWHVRHEDGAWRVHLGSWADLTRAAPGSRAFLLAM